MREISKPDQDRQVAVSQPSLITREVIEGYLNCKNKGHLKLKGEQGTKSDYEAMMSEWRIDHKRSACVSSHPTTKRAKSCEKSK